MNRQQKHAASAAAKKVAELRAQLHQELERKKLCEYKPHECTQLTVEGYNYCVKHIMEDKSAPYKQCGYTYNATGKRCHMPALKGDKKDISYCHEHAYKMYMTRVKATARHKPTNTVESILSNLSHYVIPQNEKTLIKQEIDEQSSSVVKEELKETKSLDPFKDIDSAAVAASRSKILDYGSESESDVEPACFASVWHDAQAESSEDESIDSEQEDVLKHAGIYTAEEATLVTRDKLIRLQSLYIEQFKHLQHVLREKRRKYIHALKREKETLSSIHDQPRVSAKEQRLYKKLKALNHYHKKYGIDAIMHKKFQELRTKLTEGANYKPPSFAKCSFQEGGVKCVERVMPVAKFCRKHILNDAQQVLFRRCCQREAGIECNEPVVSLSKDPVCRYHSTLPQIRNYGETRLPQHGAENEETKEKNQALSINTSEESETESNDEQDVKMDITAQSYTDVKLPLIPQDLLAFHDELSDVIIKQEVSEHTNEVNIQDIIKTEPVGIDLTDDDNLILNSVIKLTETDDTNAIKGDIKMEETAMDNVEKPPTPDDTKMPSIDPDDDVAGIMLELQKDASIH